ncbi:ComEA family DNA-binding protein [Paenibacillus ginsengarvi]|uniref:ComEA family DNA-binding protein n=1 Tax=Paenibacillus ginsengarvi TaxID=400777 RepID=UPI0013151ADF|nr:helix-hairpin-helix domain-containing protein [Paenibacillus ginsengarvi]
MLVYRKQVLVYVELLERIKRSRKPVPPVHLNECELADLLRIPEFTEKLAVRTLQVREQIGGFRSIEHFGLLLELPPRFLDQFRPYLYNVSLHEVGVAVVDA